MKWYHICDMCNFLGSNYKKLRVYITGPQQSCFNECANLDLVISASTLLFCNYFAAAEQTENHEKLLLFYCARLRT